MTPTSTFHILNIDQISTQKCFPWYFNKQSNFAILLPGQTDTYSTSREGTTINITWTFPGPWFVSGLNYGVLTASLIASYLITKCTSRGAPP